MNDPAGASGYVISTVTTSPGGQVFFEVVTEHGQRLHVSMPAKRTSGPEIAETIDHALAAVYAQPARF